MSDLLNGSNLHVMRAPLITFTNIVPSTDYASWKSMSYIGSLFLNCNLAQTLTVMTLILEVSYARSHMQCRSATGV